MSWIIVTGDSGGLGHEIVKTLLNNDYSVIGISRTENDNIVKLVQQYQNKYIHVNFDLSQSKQIRKLYREHIKPIGPISGIVNNSANAYDDIVTNIQLDKLETMFTVNVFSPMLLTKYAIRDMLLNDIKGSIVHISSVSAHTGYKGLSMYAATKGALEAFSKGTAREWGEKGVRSNCVVPGFMETAMSSSLSNEQKNRIYNRTSLKKATEASSVAEMIMFLLSDKASSITGEVMHVNCGTI